MNRKLNFQIKNCDFCDLMEKKIIGVDCDEVLCLLMEDFIEYMNEKVNLNMKYEGLKEYDLNKYFHLDKKEVIHFVKSLTE